MEATMSSVMTADGTTGKVYSTSLSDVADGVLKAKKTYISTTIISQPTKMSKYLKAFQTGTDAAPAGASIHEGTYMKSESYKSKGDGNLDMNITPYYALNNEGEEAMEYAWDNNLVNLIKNDKYGSKDSFNWGSADTSKKVPSGWTTVSSVLDVADVVFWTGILL
jgi:hypothetical protein